MKGIFITFEGTEGSGKTTVLNQLANRLEAKGYQVICTREPGGIKISEEIRKIILDVENTKMDSITEALLYAASRRQHLVEKILPYLNNGYIVLCDRYIDSSLAYQGYARGLGIEYVYQINQVATEGILPDITLYFDVLPEIGLSRIQTNNREQNRLDLEKVSFHEKVYNGYEKIKTMFPDRIKVVDGKQNKNEVLNDAEEIVLKYLQQRG